MEIYIAKNGSRSGPFNEAQVRSLVDGGLITLEDLVWSKGSDDWRPLRTLLFPDEPPPIPDALGNHATTSQAAVTMAPPTRVRAGPKGVGGWLVFFCVQLTILSPFFTVIHMPIDWEDASPAFVRYPELKDAMVIQDVGLAIVLILGFVAGTAIWSGSRRGRTWARTYLIGRLAVLLAFERFSYATAVPAVPTAVASKLWDSVVASVVTNVVIAGIWLLYFQFSRRVRNTYQ